MVVGCGPHLGSRLRNKWDCGVFQSQDTGQAVSPVTVTGNFEPEGQDVRNRQREGPKGLGIPDARCLITSASQIEEDRVGHRNLGLRRICDVASRDRKPVVVGLHGECSAKSNQN